jgi:hypothetical protein
MKTQLAKTSELTGPALDWAVAKCEGHYLPQMDEYMDVWLIVRRFSADWAMGGPIIEREEVFLAKSILGGWTGSIYVKAKDYNCIMHAAPTPLIAAMRVYVASTLGDEIELPSSLFETSVD